MKVHWTHTAEGHLDAIYAHIAQDSFEYARRMVDRLTLKSQPAQEPKIPGRTDDDDLYAYTPLLLNKTDQKHGTDEI